MTDPAPPASELRDPPLVPARIVNEHVYCPRLAWLEWEAQAFTDNVDTAEGREQHRGVDRPRGTLGDPADDGGAPAFHDVTSVRLSSERLGVVGVVDRVATDDGAVMPVEVKRGRPYDPPDRPLRDPELAQLTAQVLLLRDAGYRVERAAVFFGETRTRHDVPIPDDAEAWISRIVTEVRSNAARATPPPPLVDSPKCPRCSLVSVCLPDETNLVAGRRPKPPRRLMAGANAATPLYVTTPCARIRKDGGRLILEVDGEKIDSRRMIDVSQVAVFGNATVTAAALRACLEQDIPVLWFTHGGWLVGHAGAHGGSWVQRRLAQYAAHVASDISVPAAIVNGKIRNQRTMLRRLASPGEPVLREMAALAKKAGDASTIERLIGIEGAAARTYFAHFGAMLKVAAADGFVFTGRNRRPALDPVNATLSFTYGLLVRDCTAALVAAGLDPQVGLLHRPQFGRPSLALDLAEEFRPLIGDSATINGFNNRELGDDSFITRGGAVGLTRSGRRQVISAYERRMGHEITHPLFGYRVTYRRALEVQARLLAAVLEGQFEEYRAFVTR